MRGVANLQLMLLFHLFSEVFIDKGKDCSLILGLHGLLKLVHLVADIVTDLDSFLITDLNFFACAVLKDRFASFTLTFDFLAPIFMILNLGEEDQIFT